jgi:AAA-like domain/TIR domain
VTKILILAANPRNLDESHLDDEVQRIRAGLEQPTRDEFEIISKWVVCTADLEQLLLDLKPKIVHFLGHGAGSHGLALENEAGQVEDAETQARLFGLSSSVECVLLNVCDAGVQATAIHQYVDYVVAMNQVIGDRAAINFSVRFYDALRARSSYTDAFESGCSAALEGIPQSAMPILKVRSTQEVPVIYVPPSPAEPSPRRQARIFISYSTQEPDCRLAGEFYNDLKSYGHYAFLADKSINGGEDWRQRVDQEIGQCDLFLLLLSSHSAISNMVSVEVKRAKRFQGQNDGRPTIFPILVNFQINSSLIDLEGALNGIQLREWNSSTDTIVLLNELLKLLASGVVSSPMQPKTTPRFLENHPNHAPLHVAEPDLNRPLPMLPKGGMASDSRLYTERDGDREVLENIQGKGVTLIIRGLGKTSLKNRLSQRVKSFGKTMAILDFDAFTIRQPEDMDDLYRRMWRNLSHELSLSDELLKFQQGEDPTQTQKYMQEILNQLNKPLVLVIDHVDRIFKSHFRSNFFSQLRSLHNGRAESNTLKDLDLIILTNRKSNELGEQGSDFNVAHSIELNDFTLEQVKQLNQCWNTNLKESELKKLYELTNGHPFLVQKALYEMVRQPQRFQVEDLWDNSLNSDGPFGEHLEHLWGRISYNSSWLKGLRQIARHSNCDKLIANDLMAERLIVHQDYGYKIRYQLYENYFCQHL